MKAVKPLRQMVGLRERQHTKLVKQLGEHRALLEQRKTEAGEAAGRVQECEQKERLAVRQRTELTNAQFEPNQLLVMDLRMPELIRQIQKACAEHAQALQQVDAQEAEVQSHVHLVKRNEEKQQQLRERIDKLLKEMEEQREASDAEEAEETAAARIAKRRKQQEAAYG